MNTRDLDEKATEVLNRAIKLKTKREFAKSVGVLSALVKEKPDCFPAIWLLGGIYLSELKDFRRAIRTFQKAISLAPKSEKASLGLFHALWQSDLYNRAIAEMRRFQSVSHSSDYEEITAELTEKGILSAASNGDSEQAKLLREKIDECLTIAKNLTRPKRADVMKTLRQARKEVARTIGN